MSASSDYNRQVRLMQAEIDKVARQAKNDVRREMAKMKRKLR